MKAFGIKRSDIQSCVKGCCAGTYEKVQSSAVPGTRARRKTERQAGRRVIAQSLNGVLL